MRWPLVLTRTRREHLSLLRSRGDVGCVSLEPVELVELSGQLAVVNCIGLLAIFAAIRSSRPLVWPLHFMPRCDAAIVVPLWPPGGALWKAERLFPDSSWHLRDFLCRRLHFLDGAANLFLSLSHLLPFYFLTFLLFSTRHCSTFRKLQSAHGLRLTVARYLYGGTFIRRGFIVRGCCAASFHSRMAKLFFDAAALLLMAVAVADLAITAQMGARLDWNAFIVANDVKMLWRTNRAVRGWVAVGLLLIFAVYFSVTKLAQNYAALHRLPSFSDFRIFWVAPRLLGCSRSSCRKW